MSELGGNHVDVLVVGGGIHGVGVAQAAAARGFSVRLIERDRLAAGTSSRSSKLIHGGLRYLAAGQLGLVRECLRERRLLLRLAPTLVRLVPFHLPSYESSRWSPSMLRAGLSTYAALGGFDRTHRFTRVEPGRWPELDGLELEGLRGIFRYLDGQTDDVELTRAVMRSASTLGAELSCPARFIAARRHDEGYEVRYEEPGTGHVTSLDARVLVNAAGPWSEEVASKIEAAPPPPATELVQGTHLVLEGRLEHGVYYAESPRDGRPVFMMPWHDNILVGTTEVPFHAPPDLAAPTAEEEEYLLETWRRYFPGRPPTPLSSFAGLRVLPCGAHPLSRRSRETVVQYSPRSRPRLVTVVGGKLTTYRSTAARVVNALVPSLPPRERRADTRLLPLS